MVHPNSSSRELKCLRAALTIACSRSEIRSSRSTFRSRAMESRILKFQVHCCGLGTGLLGCGMLDVGTSHEFRRASETSRTIWSSPLIRLDTNARTLVAHPSLYEGTNLTTCLGYVTSWTTPSAARPEDPRRHSSKTWMLTHSWTMRTESSKSCRAGLVVTWSSGTSTTFR